MTKITFKDLPDTSTPLNANNLNTLQDNVENAINVVSGDIPTIDSSVSTSSTNGIENQAITNYVDDKVLDTYSTTEQRVGTWTDLRPIYKKTIVVNNTKLFNDTAIEHGISNIREIVKQEYIFNNNNTVYYSNSIVDEDGYLIFYANKTHIKCYGTTFYNPQVGRYLYSTLYYTKTSD